jgi:hypothetical protein
LNQSFSAEAEGGKTPKRSKTGSRSSKQRGGGEFFGGWEVSLRLAVKHLEPHPRVGGMLRKEAEQTPRSG